MTKKSILQNISVSLILVCVIASAAFAQQTTAFTYQGKLTDSGNPANGNYDLQFKLFDTVTVGAGAQQGATLVRNPANASAGVFSVQLDFGASVFSGAARYLEIGVRPAGNAGAYTVLTPRQLITSSPYSIQTLNALQLGGRDASEYVTTASVGNSFIKNATTQQTGDFNIGGNGIVGGRVGIGVTNPLSKLEVNGDTALTTGGSGGQVLITAPNGESGMVIRGSSRADIRFDGSTLKLLAGISTGAPISTNGIAIATSGNVGIGTVNPTSKLFVFSSTAGVSAIYGESQSGRGIWGKSVGSRGVYGESNSSEGVFGVSSSGAGVSGNSTNGIGVYGESTGSSGIGLYGRNVAGGRALLAEGNAAQSRNSNGFVKAMVYINTDGTIRRCYNGITNSSTGNCGFTSTASSDPLGYYTVDFNFQVDDRFASVSPVYDFSGVNIGTQLTMSGTTVSVKVFLTNVTFLQAALPNPFIIVVY